MTCVEKEDEEVRVEEVQVEEVSAPVRGGTGCKSGMALVNELARFHAITHTYKVCGESGPPHGRLFTVELCIGEKEVFQGSGPSIRKAQHAAAESAVKGTSFAAPVAKARKEDRKNTKSTPTVELNVWAMRHGLTVRYDVHDPQNIIPVPDFDAALLYDYRSNPHQRHHFQKTPYTAVLTVAGHVFEGSGMTPQGARHSAAEKALHVLRHSDQQNDRSNEEKSPISIVHEMAVKMNCAPQYHVVEESGPTHLPNFVIRCSVLGHSCDGQGKSKKVAKKRAAANMAQILTLLPQFSSQTVSKVQNNSEGANYEQENPEKGFAVQPCAGESVTYEPLRELISPSTSISEDDKDNPVHPVNQLSRLVRAQRKEEPKYLVIYERCVDKKRKEFVVECSVRGPKSPLLTAVGIDPLRKGAKKKAAEAMIKLIVTGRSSPEIALPPKAPHPPILKDSQKRQSSTGHSDRQRKVSFTDKSGESNKRAIVDKADMLKLSPQNRRNAATRFLTQETTDMDAESKPENSS